MYKLTHSAGRVSVVYYIVIFERSGVGTVAAVAALAATLFRP